MNLQAKMSYAWVLPFFYIKISNSCKIAKMSFLAKYHAMQFSMGLKYTWIRLVFSRFVSRCWVLPLPTCFHICIQISTSQIEYGGKNIEDNPLLFALYSEIFHQETCLMVRFMRTHQGCGRSTSFMIINIPKLLFMEKVRKREKEDSNQWFFDLAHMIFCYIHYKLLYSIFLEVLCLWMAPICC